MTTFVYKIGDSFNLPLKNAKIQTNFAFVKKGCVTMIIYFSDCRKAINTTCVFATLDGVDVTNH